MKRILLPFVDDFSLIFFIKLYTYLNKFENYSRSFWKVQNIITMFDEHDYKNLKVIFAVRMVKYKKYQKVNVVIV